jgi:hypothetical protein
MKPFNLQAALAGAAVVTRGGKKVSRLMYVPEINGTYPVLAVVGGALYTFTKEGQFVEGGILGLDLFMGTVKKSGWINIYRFDIVDDTTFRPNFSSGNPAKNGKTIHPTKDEADKAAAFSRERIDCVKLEWEE